MLDEEHEALVETASVLVTTLSTASVLVTTASYKLVLLVHIVSTAYMICISGSVIYIPVLLYLNLFLYIFVFILIYIDFLNVTKRCIQAHLLTRLVTVCLIRCMTKYYKRPHKKIHVAI